MGGYRCLKLSDKNQSVECPLSIQFPTASQEYFSKSSFIITNASYKQNEGDVRIILLCSNFNLKIAADMIAEIS